MQIALKGMNQKWFRRRWFIGLLERLNVSINYRGKYIDLEKDLW